MPDVVRTAAAAPASNHVLLAAFLAHAGRSFCHDAPILEKLL